MSRTRPAHAPLAVALRAVVAMLAVLAFLAIRPALSAGPQAAARFGLGILLFALLVDLGRSVAGSGPVLRGHLAPHRQQAEAQVDEAYERLREAVGAYLEEGRPQPALLEEIDQAAAAQGLPAKERQRLTDRLQRAGRPRAPAASLLTVRLLSGLVVTLGVGLLAAVLAENLGMMPAPPVLLAVGTSIATLQWRARDAGARWIGLALGVLGAGLFALAALRIFALSPAVGGLLLLPAGLGLAGTVYATWKAPATDRLEEDLDATLTKLRRAFLLALLGGVVVLLMRPLLEAFLEAVGLSADPVIEVSLILLVTVFVFLAVETAGTWLALRREGHRTGRDRRRRREAIDDVLDRIEDASTPSLEEIA